MAFFKFKLMTFGLRVEGYGPVTYGSRLGSRVGVWVFELESGLGSRSGVRNKIGAISKHNFGRNHSPIIF